MKRTLLEVGDKENISGLSLGDVGSNVLGRSVILENETFTFIRK